MKIKILLLVALIVFVFTGVMGDRYYSQLLSQLNQDKPVKTATLPDKLFGWKFPVTKFPLTGPDGKQIAYSDIRDPGGIPQGLPVRLKIPAIGVDTAIEDAYITPDGRMDVPAGSVNVAWFALGPHPGKEGSAVIGGHFGIDNGKPKVFFDLNKLKAGDKIYIVDDKGDTLAFVVQSTKSFDRNADATTVFTSGDGLAHLNIITCEGVWNQVDDSYPDRLVVFTDAIPAEAATAVNTPAPVDTKPKTATKATPSTSSPLRQGSEGQAVPTATQLPTLSPTAPPTEKIATPSREKNSLASSQILIASAKSLYATPIDGLVTSFLLLSIIFITFKIIRRYYAGQSSV